MMRLSLVLALALLATSARAGVLSVTKVTLGGLTKTYTKGETLSFVDIQSVDSPNGDY